MLVPLLPYDAWCLSWRYPGHSWRLTMTVVVVPMLVLVWMNVASLFCFLAAMASQSSTPVYLIFCPIAGGVGIVWPPPEPTTHRVRTLSTFHSATFVILPLPDFDVTLSGLGTRTAASCMLVWYLRSARRESRRPSPRSIPSSRCGLSVRFNSYPCS